MTEHASSFSIAPIACATDDTDHKDCGRWGPQYRSGSKMHYTNSQMKLDQLIGYFNSKKINLIPPFQRGHVWDLSLRRGLLQNMVSGRPIPAIFLYKQASGSQFAYNILDGKQRLESLILYIGTARTDFYVSNVKDYFFDPKEKKQANYAIQLEGKKCTFADLPDDVVRAFREYAIPTIEIDLDDDSTTLDEIINLFVDINQKGERVKRFDIVKAIGQENQLLKSVFDMVAQQQTRKGDKFFKKKSNAFTRVLDHLQIVQAAKDPNQKVDRMWERLVEIVLFNRTQKHRQAGQVLKAFIKSEDNDIDTKQLAAQELAKLRTVFNFLDRSYKDSNLGKSRLGRDLPHFYTMVTTLLSSDLLSTDGAPPAYPAVNKKLLAFAKTLEMTTLLSGSPIKEPFDAYKEASAKQTTHPGRRKTRQDKMLEILGHL